MNLTTEIILWSVSLSLALFGAIFGITAAINSNKANNQLTNLIATTWIAEESEKLFFTNIKAISIENRLTTAQLKKTNCTFSQYSNHGSYTRMNPVHKKVIASLKDTDYSDLINMYVSFKKNQDNNFMNAINGDYRILSKRIKIDSEIKKALLSHHQLIDKQSKIIMKKYVEITN